MTNTNSGNNSSPILDKLNTFLERMDTYLENNRLSFPRVFRPEFCEAEGFSLDQLNKLTQDQCFSYGFMMLNYADHINLEKSRQLTIMRYCEWALNQILASELPNMPEFTKHDIKVSMILKENHVAQKLKQWYNETQARHESLINREQLVRRKADLLIEKGKRK